MPSKYYNEEELTLFIERKVEKISFLDSIFNSKKHNDCKARVKDKVKAVKEGEGNSIVEIATKLSKSIVRPPQMIRKYEGFKSDFAIDITLHNSRNISLDFFAPSRDNVPKFVRVKKNKKILEVPRKLSEINEEFNEILLAQVIAIALIVFKYLPTIERAYINVREKRINTSKGNEYEPVILSCILDPEVFDSLVFKNLTPEAVIRNFPHHYVYDKDHYIKDVSIPYSYLPHPHNKIRVNLDSVDPKEFERLIKNLLQKMGFIAEVTKDSHDGGIDVIALSNNPITGGRIIVQCKRRKDTIPVEIIRDLYGALTHERANKGILIATSNFSYDCEKFADGKPIELIDRRRLELLLKENGLID